MKSLVVFLAVLCLTASAQNIVGSYNFGKNLNESCCTPLSITISNVSNSSANASEVQITYNFPQNVTENIWCQDANITNVTVSNLIAPIPGFNQTLGVAYDDSYSDSSLIVMDYDFDNTTNQSVFVVLLYVNITDLTNLNNTPFCGYSMNSTV